MNATQQQEIRDRARAMGINDRNLTQADCAQIYGQRYERDRILAEAKRRLKKGYSLKSLIKWLKY